MHKSLLLSVLLAAPMVAAPARAEFRLTPSPNHPERHWQVMETAHFRIHFYQGHRRLAERMAGLAEDAYGKVTADLGAEPKDKVPLILTQDEFLNGSAEPFKNRIMLDPVLARGSVIGARRFLTHEFAHVITFEAMASGMPVSKLTSLMAVPAWFLEGVAQYEAEYWYPSLDRMLRLHTLNDSLLTPSQRDAFLVLGPHEGSAAYNEGFSLVRYMFLTYGHGKLAQLMATMRAGGADFQEAIGLVFGKPLSVLEAEWREQLMLTYHAQTKGVDAQLPGSEPIVPYQEGKARIAPSLSPDGRWMAFLSSHERPGYLNLRGHLLGLMPLYVAPAGKPQEAVKVADGVVEAKWSPNGETLAIVQRASDRYDQPTFKLSLRKVSEDDKKPGKAQLGPAREVALDYVEHVAWSPDGRDLAVVARDGEDAIVARVDRPSRQLKDVLLRGDNGREFGQLAWGIRGIAVTTYLPGNGPKIQLVHPTKRTVTALTTGTVIVRDTDPVWSPEGRYLYFVSDRTGLSQLYRFDMDKKQIERLTHTYSGVETPFLLEDGKSLWYAEHRAKGTELRRWTVGEPLEVKGLALAQAGTQAPLNPPRAVLPPDTRVEPYQVGLSPDVIVPMSSADEKGDALGLRMSFNDILYKHALDATLIYGLVSNRFSYGISYFNAMFDPSLAAHFFDTPELAITADGKGAYWQRDQGLALLAGRPIIGRHVLTGGVTFGRLSYLSGLTERAEKPEGTREGWSNGLLLAWSHENVGSSVDADVHPPSGHRYSARIRQGVPALGSQFTFTQVEAEARQYVPILETGHVLAIRGLGGKVIGDSSPFLMGGAPLNQALGIQIFTPLRGYSFAEFFGDNLALASAEYRVPLLDSLDTLLGSLYLDRLYGSLFTDVGDAWFTTERGFSPKVGVGAELRARLGVSNRNSLSVYVGLAKGLMTEKGPQPYFGFANIF